MQTRDYKQCAPETYYHIYNRGNDKDIVFKDHADYSFFLLRLRQNLAPDGHEPRMFRPLPKNSFSLAAFCLMPNHFHLLIRQNNEIPTSKLIGKLCTSYSKYFNKKYARVGHVFQDQFKQITIDSNRYLLWLSVYIHLNPYEAGLIADPELYPYSSVTNYTQPNNPGLIIDDIVTSQFSNKNGYRDFLLENINMDQKYKTIPPDLFLDL